MPSSVFASEFEEDVGLLNKAAPVSGMYNFNFKWTELYFTKKQHIVMIQSFSFPDKSVATTEECLNLD